VIKTFEHVKRLVEEQTHATVFKWHSGFCIAYWAAHAGQWKVENLTSDTFHYGHTPEEAAAKCYRVKLWSLAGICKHLGIIVNGY
jgi:hypothetical protein